MQISETRRRSTPNPCASAASSSTIGASHQTHCLVEAHEAEQVRARTGRRHRRPRGAASRVTQPSSSMPQSSASCPQQSQPSGTFSPSLDPMRHTLRRVREITRSGEQIHPIRGTAASRADELGRPLVSDDAPSRDHHRHRRDPAALHGVPRGDALEECGRASGPRGRRRRTREPSRSSRTPRRTRSSGARKRRSTSPTRCSRRHRGGDRPHRQVALGGPVLQDTERGDRRRPRRPRPSERRAREAGEGGQGRRHDRAADRPARVDARRARRRRQARLGNAWRRRSTTRRPIPSPPASCDRRS